MCVSFHYSLPHYISATPVSPLPTRNICGRAKLYSQCPHFLSHSSLPLLLPQFEEAIKVYSGGLRFASSPPYSSWSPDTTAYTVELNNTLAELYPPV